MFAETWKLPHFCIALDSFLVSLKLQHKKIDSNRIEYSLMGVVDRPSRPISNFAQKAKGTRLCK